jgi:hypothetical protein
MTAQEIQARIRGRIWQSIAQNSAIFGTISQEELTKFADSLTDSILQDVDDVLTVDTGAASTATPTAVPLAAESQDTHVEEVLWEGRPFLSISTRYTITTERVRIVTGLLSKEREDIELVRIQDIDQSQSLGERFVNVGDITIHSHDPSHPNLILNNVANVLEVHEILRAAVLAARKRHNFHYREQM